MKDENEVNNTVGCLHSFMKKIKVYIRVSNIVFLFVKMEDNNFIKEMKMFSVLSLPGENLDKVCKNILEQLKNFDCVLGIH